MSQKNISKSGKQSWCRSVLCDIWQQLRLNGPHSYAFIYSSWEVVRARKVGTTRTQFDSVVYRLFYPILLIGVFMFSLCNEVKFLHFFCLLETWNLILQIIYGLLFLSNVLNNNVYRENVEHRQKIPERIVVTGEVVKGGRTFYICKRYSILPMDKLNPSERIIWFLYTILASLNLIRLYGMINDTIQIAYPHRTDYEKIRAIALGVFMFADTILTPIPVYIVHVIFPLTYYCLYLGFGKILYEYRNISLYTTDSQTNWTFTLLKLLAVFLSHTIVVVVARLRDFIISLIDDSRTPKKLHDLRIQKRLMRRRLMNYVEGPDGKVIGITLDNMGADEEKDEFVQTALPMPSQQQVRKRTSKKNVEVETIKSRGDWTESSMEELVDSVPITVAKTLKSPPTLRYVETPKESQFSSSSSDEMEAVKKELARLPKAPTEPSKMSLTRQGHNIQYGHHGHRDHGHRVNREDDTERRHLEIKQKEVEEKLRAITLGRTFKPRDSKEKIQLKLEDNQPKRDNLDEYESPPTPPFLKLVQTLVNQKKDYDKWETRQREIQKQKQHSYQNAYKQANTSRSTKSTTRRKDFAEERQVKQANMELEVEEEVDRFIEKQILGKPAQYMIDDAKKKNEIRRGSKVADFRGNWDKKRKEAGKEKVTKTKSILKVSHSSMDGAQLASVMRLRRRENRILRRQKERVAKGRAGKAAYDPTQEPEAIKSISTTYHILGTKLKGDKLEKTTVSKDDVKVYKIHPGFSTTDDVERKAGEIVEEGGTRRGVVAFHPLVRYFNVNEVEDNAGNEDQSEIETKNNTGK